MRLVESKNRGANRLHGVKSLIKVLAGTIKNAVDVLAINSENILVVFGEVDAGITPRGGFFDDGGGRKECRWGGGG